MSHFLDMKVPLTNPEAIVNGLVRKGVPLQDIEVHKQPTRLIGYNGQDRMANIIVRKNSLNNCSNATGMKSGAYSDLGFAEQADGTYKVLVDDINFNPTWVEELSMYHNVESAKIALDNKKIKYVESEEEGLPVIKATIPNRQQKKIAPRRTISFS